MSNVSRSRSSYTHSEVEVKYHHKLDSSIRKAITDSKLGEKF